MEDVGVNIFCSVCILFAVQREYLLVRHCIALHAWFIIPQKLGMCKFSFKSFLFLLKFCTILSFFLLFEIALLFCFFQYILFCYL